MRRWLLTLVLVGCAAPLQLSGGSRLALADVLDAHLTYVAISENGRLLGEAGTRPQMAMHRFPAMGVVVVKDGQVMTVTPELLAPDSPTRAILRAWMSAPMTTLIQWPDGEASAEVIDGGALVLVRRRLTECRDDGNAVELTWRVLLFVSAGRVEERGKTLVDEQAFAHGCRDRSR